MSEKRIKSVPFVLRLEPGEKEWYLEAARKQGYRELSPWFRWRMSVIAEELAGPFKPQAPKKKPAKKVAKKKP